MKPIIYVDMDGVLVNLFNHIGFIHETHYTNLTRAQMDKFFHDADAYELFRDAPAFDHSNELIQMVKDLFGGYKILSSPLGLDPVNSVRGKKEWLEKHLTVPADEWVFEHDKHLYAKQEDGTPNVLIDDFKVNIQRWDNAGGIAIKWQGDENTLNQLKNQLLLIAME